MSVDPTAAAPAAVVVPPPPTKSPGTTTVGGFEMRLADFNPLQYLPIIGTIYRAITGDLPDPACRIGGSVMAGALVGGPVGIVTSLVGLGMEELFHRIIGDAEPATGDGDPVIRQQAATAYAAAADLGGYQVPQGSG